MLHEFSVEFSNIDIDTHRMQRSHYYYWAFQHSDSTWNSDICPKTEGGRLALQLFVENLI